MKINCNIDGKFKPFWHSYKYVFFKYIWKLVVLQQFIITYELNIILRLW